MAMKSKKFKKGSYYKFTSHSSWFVHILGEVLTERYGYCLAGERENGTVIFLDIGLMGDGWEEIDRAEFLKAMEDYNAKIRSKL